MLWCWGKYGYGTFAYGHGQGHNLDGSRWINFLKIKEYKMLSKV